MGSTCMGVLRHTVASSRQAATIRRPRQSLESIRVHSVAWVGPIVGETAYSTIVAKATGTPATTALARAGVSFTLHAYDHDPAAQSFGREAAAALGVPPGRVFKTLVVDLGGSVGVGIVPVDCQLDLKAVAAALGAKRAVMATPAVAERVTGYVVGGISPVGQKRLLATVLDTTATTYPTILVSGGRRGWDVELTPEDLLAVTRGRLAPIARP